MICEPLRTAVGRFGGALRTVTAATLAARVIEDILAKTRVPHDSVDDVVLGQAYASGEEPALGRVAALDAGLPVTVSGYQVDRRCGSGLEAVLHAAMQVQTGVSDVVLAGGAENMSQVEHYTTSLRWGSGHTRLVLYDRLNRARVTAGGVHHLIEGGMLETAEDLRREFSISRRAQDELALESHRRAIDAQTAGRFAHEIVPLTVSTSAPDRGGEPISISSDEHPRSDTTLERLGALRPVLSEGDPDATVTSGNASGQNDAAAVCLVTFPEKAAELGLQPMLRLRSWSSAGVEPERMGLGPVPATARALSRAGLSLADMTLIELNEAFAAQVLACTISWKFEDADFDRLNVNGSGISLGHPVGATGARILATLAHEMRRRGATFGLETMCIGGGQGLAAVFELVS